jgi:AcrR family transcriptional regulator
MPKIVADEQIFQAVIQVVSERGYAGATTRQMADAAGVSEVTLFRKYETKAQLVKQAILFIIANSYLGSQPQYTGDVHADLLRIVQAYQDTAAQHGIFVFTLFSEFSRYPELAEVMDAPLAIFHNIGGLIERYQVEGILAKEQPLYAVATLLAPVMYISTLRKAQLDTSLPELDFAEHVTVFLEGRKVG